MEKILLIEDNGALVRDLTNGIKQLKPEIVIERAYSYISAIEKYIYKGDFACIILDLNIDPDGLEVEKVNQYCPLYGMAFLDKICNGKESEEVKLILDKTIIYSGYIDELKNRQIEFNWDLNLLELVPKNTRSINKLLTIIKKLL